MHHGRPRGTSRTLDRPCCGTLEQLRPLAAVNVALGVSVSDGLSNQSFVPVGVRPPERSQMRVLGCTAAKEHAV